MRRGCKPRIGGGGGLCATLVGPVLPTEESVRPYAPMPVIFGSRTEGLKAAAPKHTGFSAPNQIKRKITYRRTPRKDAPGTGLKEIGSAATKPKASYSLRAGTNFACTSSLISL